MKKTFKIFLFLPLLFPLFSCSGTAGSGSSACIPPGTTEICGDGIDQDCNGSDLECPPPTSVTISGVTTVGSSGIISEITHGTAYRVSGSGFGTKNPVEPTVWENFENGGNTLLLSSTGYWSSSDNTFSNELNRPNSTLNAKCYLSSGVEGMSSRDNLPLGDHFYANLWLNPDYGVGDPQIQVKILGFSQYGDFLSYDIGYPSLEEFLWTYDNLSHNHYWQLYQTPGTPGGAGIYGLPLMEQRVWTNIETEVIQADVGISNGIFKYWMNGKNYLIRDDLALRPTVSDNWQNFFFGWYIGNGGQYATEYFDNIYIDATIARVMICSQSIWDDQSVRHCEIQIPQNVWNDGTIEFLANKGSFTTGQSLFLYVVNSGGTANSSGHPLLFK